MNLNNPLKEIKILISNSKQDLNNFKIKINNSIESLTSISNMRHDYQKRQKEEINNLRLAVKTMSFIFIGMCIIELIRIIISIVS